MDQRQLPYDQCGDHACNQNLFIDLSAFYHVSVQQHCVTRIRSRYLTSLPTNRFSSNSLFHQSSEILMPVTHSHEIGANSPPIFLANFMQM